jgi:predicted phosphodiesterase
VHRDTTRRLPGLGIARLVRLVLVPVLLGLLGGLAGLQIGAHISRDIGPVSATMSLEPSLPVPGGGTEVDIPPLGSLRFSTHRGPVRLGVGVQGLNQADVREILNRQLDSVSSDRIARDVRRGIVALVVRSLVAAAAGGLAVGLLAYRRLRPTLLTGGISLAFLATSLAIAGLTWNPAAIVQPRYTGLLDGAPSLIGTADTLITRFQSYRIELGRLVTNVSRLYGVVSTLPTYESDTSTLRVLSVSDIHDNPAAWTIMHTLVSQFHIELIVDSGDLTDHGSPAEDVMASQIGTFDIPYVFVKGNHDSAGTAAAVARQHNAIVLTGTTVDVAGLRIIGDADPRFTPDLAVQVPTTSDLLVAGQRLAEAAQAGPPPDLAVVHDPAEGEALAADVPLVVAGHTHRRFTQIIGKDTRLFVQGSTGGAGLRALETSPPTPIECSVLYFDRTTRRLQAWDDVTLGGLGATSAGIARHMATEPSPAPSPTPSLFPDVTGTATATVAATATAGVTATNR